MKLLIWLGNCRSELKDFPDEVRRAIGHSLHLVQLGENPFHGKVFTGLGNAKVWELRENDPSGTYRAVYTVEFKGYVFVLHVFQKKSKTGIATPKKDIDLILQRLKEAKEVYKQLIEDEG